DKMQVRCTNHELNEICRELTCHICDKPKIMLNLNCSHCHKNVCQWCLRYCYHYEDPTGGVFICDHCKPHYYDYLIAPPYQNCRCGQKLLIYSSIYGQHPDGFDAIGLFHSKETCQHCNSPTCEHCMIRMTDTVRIS